MARGDGGMRAGMAHQAALQRADRLESELSRAGVGEAGVRVSAWAQQGDVVIRMRVSEADRLLAFLMAQR